MFINFTNHASSMWSDYQIQEAAKYGEIVDIPFPAVEPDWSKELIQATADKYIERIVSKKPDCVLCQGEFCLSFAVIKGLKARGLKVVAACSKRDVEEVSTNKDTKKISRFVFVQFREY